MTLTPAQFVAKWQTTNQTEIALYQTHFNDICTLVGHDDPIQADPTGQNFAFESRTRKVDGRHGRADVFYRDHFIWEYKGPHANLDKAYQQLLLYREELGNPPLLITSDIHTIIIHTNFTNRPKESHTIDFDRLRHGDGLDLLQRVFYNPHSFQPERTKQAITKASADTFIIVADALKKQRDLMQETHTDEELAHFMVRLLFCLFAEDLNLLPNDIFTQIVQAQGRNYVNLQKPLKALFLAMRDGGMFGIDEIRYFDGDLFDSPFVPSIPDDLGRALLRVANQDWADIDPAIFGTLFERIIDESKRSQLGAHYTSQEDIELLIEPVLIHPLREEWAAVRLACVRQPELAPTKLMAFNDKLAGIRVLDPACGSGNFLYVALQKLLDLQKEVILFAAQNGYPNLSLTVGPHQLYGLEINPYAHELAQITAWIGYLQWRMQNGFEEIEEPVLRPLHNIQRRDAILSYDEAGNPLEPAWPPAEVIIGNPPFLGSQRMLSELGEAYVKDLRQLYENRLSGQSDLVCYWFEKAYAYIDQGHVHRAGLIATNSIRGGANRETLKRIKSTGDIFMAWSDNPWILEGAAVRVSLIGFDNGSTQKRMLDGRNVKVINSDLTTDIDLTDVARLEENRNLAFQGPVKVGAFEIDAAEARKMLADENPTGVSNHDVVKPWMNGADITRRPRHMWIIDFDKFELETAAQYLLPFAHVERHVAPFRAVNTSKHRRKFWWRLGSTGGNLIQAKQGLPRLILTPRVSKHRLFIWAATELVPDSATVAITREDDYFFGVLHSTLHERWSLRLGTWLGKGNDPRYTPTTTFETFPFPWPPGEEPAANPLVQAIATAASKLNEWREAWLNPTLPETGIISVTHEKMLKKRTLTNLYNGLVYYRTHPGPAFAPADFTQETRGAVTRTEIEALHDLHQILDTAVCDAYGWPHDILQDEEQLLINLLTLNQRRAATKL